MMSHPRLLMLDEPSMGLSPLLVDEVFDIIKEFHESGMTVLLVEQNAGKSLAISDRAYVLENGKIVLLTATPETIFDRVKDHTHRPILNSDMSLKHVKELMTQREPRYQSVADIKVNVDSNDRVLTCYNILKELKEMGQIE